MLMVFVIGYVVRPHALASGSRRLPDCEMRHEAIHGCSMPVPDSGLGVDGVSLAQGRDLAVPLLYQCYTLNNVEILANGMGVPSRAGTRGEMDCVDPDQRRVDALDYRVYMHVPGEQLRGTNPGGDTRLDDHRNLPGCQT